jgi:Icc-related predicted phosphoesterase
VSRRNARPVISRAQYTVRLPWFPIHRVRFGSMECQLQASVTRVGPLQRIKVRVAAIGDLHVRGQEDLNAIPGLANLSDNADLLLVAGDLTENGRLLEAEVAGELLAAARLPVVAVLGNHDLRSLRRVAFRRVLERSGVEVLDGCATVHCLTNGTRLGVAGTAGSGGGFWPHEGPDAIHTRTLKRLAIRARRECQALERALLSLDADVRIAMLHFAPTTTTLGREPLAKYWMLGNCELGAVLDRRLPDLVIHGHAHLGTLKGSTLGGVPVRNVALPVAGRVHLEVLELERELAMRMRGHPQASDPVPVVRWP